MSLWPQDPYQHGREDGKANHRPDAEMLLDREYRQGYSRGRAERIDSELKRAGKPKPGSWGGGGSEFKTRGPLLGGGCLVLALALAAVPPLVALAVMTGT